MLGGRTSEEWIAQYASSHQHPVNRFCHTFGIPLIVISIILFVVSSSSDTFSRASVLSSSTTGDSYL
jgi:uncharacterized membrane protein YGL010W